MSKVGNIQSLNKKYRQINNKLVALAILILTLFAINTSDVKAQRGCGVRDTISSAATIESVTRCIPYAEVRIVYTPTETASMLDGDIWIINFGNNVVLQVEVETDNTVRSTGLPAGLSYGSYPASSTSIYAGYPYHSYTYTTASADCMYRVTLEASRQCGAGGVKRSNPQSSDVPIFDHDRNIAVNNETKDEIYLCEGSYFDQEFRYAGGLNCTDPTKINTPGYNGDFLSGVPGDENISEHRGFFWNLDFSTFNAAQRGQMNVMYNRPVGFNPVTLALPTMPVSGPPNAIVSYFSSYTLGVVNPLNLDKPRTILPSSSTIYSPGQTEISFAIYLRFVNSFCSRESVRLGVLGPPLSTRTRVVKYIFVKGPAPPTVASSTIYHCLGTPIDLGVTKTDPAFDLIFYERQGADAAALNTVTTPASGTIAAVTKNYIAAGSTPVAMNSYQPQPTMSGVYTYYAVQRQTSNGVTCDSEVAQIEVVVLPPMARPTFTPPSACVFGQLTLDAGSVPADVTVPVITTGITPAPAPTTRTIQTEWVWTLPNNTYFATGTGITSGIGPTATTANHTTRNRTAVFNVLATTGPGSSTVGSPNTRNVTLTRRYTNTSPAPGIANTLCTSTANTQTFTETYVNASVNDDGMFCYNIGASTAGDVFVTLSGYIPNRRYNINFSDNFSNTYTANNVLLAGPSTSVQLTPNAGSSFRIGQVHNVIITRMAILDGASNEECINDSAGATATPATGAVFPNTGSGARVMPELLSAKTTGGSAASPDATICPGDSYTINLPVIPLAQLGATATNPVIRTAVLSPVSANFTTSITLNQVVLTAKERRGNISANFRIRRELITPNAGPNNNQLCDSQVRDYYINVRTAPYASIIVPTPNLANICNSDDGSITFGSFEGQNVATGTFEIEVINTSNGNAARTFTVTPNGMATVTQTVPNAFLIEGTNLLEITKIRELTGGPGSATSCEFEMAKADPAITQTALRIVKRLDLNYSGKITTYDNSIRFSDGQPYRIDQRGQLYDFSTRTVILCGGKSQIGLRVEDNSGNVILPPAGTEYVWNLPPGWIVDFTRQNGAEIEVTVAAGNGIDVIPSVTLRYITGTMCDVTVLSDDKFNVSGQLSSPFINPVNVCGTGKTVTFKSRKLLGNGDSAHWTMISNPGANSIKVLTVLNSTVNYQYIDPSIRQLTSLDNRVEMTAIINTLGTYHIGMTKTPQNIIRNCRPQRYRLVFEVRSLGSTPDYTANFAGPDQDVCGTDNTGAIIPAQLSGAVPRAADSHVAEWVINSYQPQGLVDATNNPVSFTPTNTATNPVLATFDDNTKNDAMLTIGAGQYGRYELTYTINSSVCETFTNGTSSMSDTLVVESKMPISIDDIDISVGATPPAGTSLGTIDRVPEPNEVTLCMSDSQRATGFDLSAIVNGPLVAGTGGATWSVGGGGSGTFSNPRVQDRTAAANPGVALPNPTATEFTTTYTPAATDFGRRFIIAITPNVVAGYPCPPVSRLIAVTLQRSPTVSNVQDVVICNGDDFEFDFTSDGSATTSYDWTVQMVGQANNTLPYPFNAANTATMTSNSGNIARTSYNNATTTVYRATLTVRGRDGTCQGPPRVINVTLLPSFSLTTTLSGEICTGSSFNLNIPRAGYSTITDHTGSRVPIKLEYTVEDYGNNASKRGNFTSPPAVQLVQTAIPADITARFNNAGNANYGAPNVFSIPASQLSLTNTVSNSQQISISIRTFVDFSSSTGISTKCYGPSYTYNLTIYPRPIINPLPVTSVLDGEQLDLHSSIRHQITPVSDVEYTWVVRNINSVNGNNTLTGAVSNTAFFNGSISQVLSITNVAPNVAKRHITFEYVVTPRYRGIACSTGTPQTYVVVVMPKPEIVPLSSQTICSGGTLLANIESSNIGDGATADAEHMSVDYIIDIPASGSYTSSANVYTPANEINTTLTADALSTTPVNVSIRITPRYRAVVSGNDFFRSGDDVIYNVTLLPITRITNTQTVYQICDNSRFQFTPTHSITSPTPPIDYSWRIVPPATVGTPALSVTGTTGGLTNTGTSIDGIFDFAGALTSQQTVTIEVTPRYQNGTTGAGVPVYCNGTQFDITLNVVPSPVVTTAATFSTCSGSIVFEQGNAGNSQPFSVDPVTADVSWTVVDGNPAGEVTGYASAGTGAFNQTIVNNTATNKDITVRFTSSLGVAPNICSSSTIDKVITIAPGPTTNNVNLNPLLCSLNKTTGIVAADPNNIDYVITPSATIGGISYEYKSTVTDSAGNITTNGISIYSSAGTAITLNPAANNTTPHFTHTTAGLSALSSSVGGATIDPFRLKVVNTSLATVIVSVTFNALLPGVAGCKGAEFTVRFFVQPKPVISNLPTLTAGAGNTDFHFEVCSGDVFDFTPTSVVTNTNLRFRYTSRGNRVGSPSPIAITGVPASGIADRDSATTTVPSNITFTPSFVGTTPQYLHLELTPELRNVGGTDCLGDVEDVYIKVLPIPSVALDASSSPLNGTDIVVCNGSPFEIFVSGTVAGTEYTWTATANNNVGLQQTNFVTNNYPRFGSTGVVATAATVTSIYSGSFAHNENTEQVVEYTITPRLSKSVSGVCTSSPLTVRVLIQPRPRITNAPATNVEVCSGDTYNFVPTTNITGTVSYRWELLSNSGSGITIASAATPTVEHSIQDTTTATPPTIAVVGGNAIVQTGTVDHVFRNSSSSSALLRFRVTPILPTAIATQSCDGIASTFVLEVEPQAVGSASLRIDAVDHDGAYNYDPGIMVTGITYDWRAVIPAGVSIIRGGATVRQQVGVQSLNFSNLRNTTDNVQVIEFSITPKVPGSSCTGAIIRVDVYVLPELSLTLTPSNMQTICSDDSMGLLIQDNITTANANITHTYDWTATAVGTNVREVTPAIVGPPAVARSESAVVLGAVGVAKSNIGAVGNKRLGITNPSVNIANESVTYTFTSRFVYNYTDGAGMAQSVTSATKTASVVYTVVPTPVTSAFQITDVAGNVINAGGDVCRGQIVTYQFDVSPTTPNGTVGNTYSVTAVTGVGSVAANAPIISVNGNRALVRYNNGADWSGVLRVVETSSVNSCNGAEVLLPIRTIAAPVANAGADRTVCSGDAVTLGTDAAGMNIAVATSGVGAVIPGALYRWEPTQYLDISVTGNSFTVEHPVVVPTRTTTYRLVVTVPNGCSSIADTVTITVAPTPSKAVITGVTGNICENDNYIHTTAGGVSTFTAKDVVLTSSVSPSTTSITWYHTATNVVPTAADVISTATPPTGVVFSASNPATPAILDVLTVTGVGNNGFYRALAVGPPAGGSRCNPAVSDAFRVSFIANPSRPTITVSQGASNDNFLCSTGSESITLTASGSLPSYKWYYFDPSSTGAGSPTSSQTATLVAGATSSTLVLSRPLQSGFYAAVGISASGCESSLSPYQEIIILRKLTTPWVTSSNASSVVCENGSITLTANLSELLATPPTVAAADVEFVWTLDPDGAPGNGDDRIVTAVGGTTALTSTNPTPFTGSSITISSATTTNAGNYSIVARRRQASTNVYTVNGNPRPAGTILYCPTDASRPLTLSVVQLPPSPVLSIPATTTNPFCGDKGATRSFIISATHPSSTAATPVAYDPMVSFKWERKGSHTDPDTSYTIVPNNEVGTSRLALTDAVHSGVYRVTAEIRTGGMICANPPSVYPVSTATPNTVTIYDSPKRISLTPNKTIVCFSDRLSNSTGVLSNFRALDESNTSINGTFTLDLEVSIPDATNPNDNTARTTRRFTQTYTTTTAAPVPVHNLNNPTGNTTTVGGNTVGVDDLFQNNSSVNAVYRFTVVSVVDGNGCGPAVLPTPFEVTVLPSPNPSVIRTAVTSSGQPAATVRTTGGVRSAVICGDGTRIVRFEIDPVSGTSYQWGFRSKGYATDATLTSSFTDAQLFEYVRGGSSADTYVEVKFIGGSMANNPIMVRVIDGTTGCSTERTLDVTIFGPVLAKAGDDYSICPENTHSNPTTSANANLSVTRQYVQLGNNNNATVGNQTPGKQPGSGVYTYLWQVETTAGLIPIPAAHFQAGSTATDEKPFVSPTATTTYAVTVTDTGAGCNVSEDKLTVYVFPKPAIAVRQTILGVCSTNNGIATIGSVNAPASTSSVAEGTDGALPMGSVAPTPALTGAYEYVCEDCDDTTANPAVYIDGTEWKFDRDKTRTNPTNANKVGTYNITILYRDPRGCSQTEVGSFTVQVYPQPTISAAAVAAVCLNTPPFKLEGMISGIAIPASVTASTSTVVGPAALQPNEYRMSGPGVSRNAVTGSFMFDPMTAGVSNRHDIIFEYTDGSGCQAVPFTIPIRVKELPNLSIATQGTTGTRFNFGICEGQGASRGYLLSEGRLTLPGTSTAIALTGTRLAGVVYSGAGVTADAANPGSFYFRPSVAGVGDHTITFSYTDQNAPAGEIRCQTSTTYRIKVWDAPVITFPNLADVSKCAPLFNLTTATASPDLSSLTDVPNQPVGIYRDVLAITRGVVDGYDLKAPGQPLTNTAIVIREVDAANQTIAFEIDPQRSVTTVGTHLLRYDYTDGFGCSNVVPTTATLKIVPPPSPTLSPKDPKDTNPVVADRKTFSAVCPNDSPFEITFWGSAPPTGGTGVYDTADSRMSRLISARTTSSGIQYWFTPAELYNLSSTLVDLSRAFSINIKYTVTDASGCSGFDTQPILITPVPSGTITALGDTCNGSPLEFRMNQQGYAPFQVEYFDISEPNNPFMVQAGHVHRVNIEPSKTTIYRIKSITDANGCKNQSPPRSQAIISATPNAAFKPDPVTQTVPNKTVTFENESNSDAWEFNWEFGDGTRINGKKSDGAINITHADGSKTTGSYVTPVHTYRNGGTYSVILRATGGNCDHTATNIVTIESREPTVDFLADKQTGCAPLEITFTNLSKFVNNEDYMWTFGEGVGKSRSTNPSFTFTKPGVYSVTLLGSSAVGNPVSKVKEKYITVYATPDARFTIDPRTVYLPNQPIRTSNLSFGATDYLWNFGDGGTSKEVEPVYIYEKSGQYDVTLKATNGLTGCSDDFTIVGAVTAVEEGKILIPNAFTPVSSISEGTSNSLQVGFSSPDPSINNNVFAPIVTRAVKYEMLIFNKLGMLLFATETQSVGWNGYYKGELLPVGVYTYKIKVEFANGKRVEEKGDVALIR